MAGPIFKEFAANSWPQLPLDGVRRKCQYWKVLYVLKNFREIWIICIVKVIKAYFQLICLRKYYIIEEFKKMDVVALIAL